jgi:hypothetical protein
MAIHCFGTATDLVLGVPEAATNRVNFNVEIRIEPSCADPDERRRTRALFRRWGYGGRKGRRACIRLRGARVDVFVTYGGVTDLVEQCRLGGRRAR